MSPERWTALSHVVSVQSGYAFKSQDYTESGHFLMRIGNVQDGKISLDNPKFVELDKRTKPFELSEGDILTSLTGNIGRVARISESDLPAALNQRVAKLVVKDASRLTEEYLFHFLNSQDFREKLSSDGHGAAQQNVSPKAIGAIPIPLPPLEEQRRIVAVLDEAFAAIATATANAEKNLANARALFEASLGKVFSLQQADWKDTQIGQIADVSYGYTEKATFEPVGPKFLRITDIQEGEVDWEQVPNCPISAKDYRRQKLENGDIVFARTGATTGKSFLVKDPPAAVAASYLIRLRITHDDVSPDFVQLFFQTPQYWQAVGEGTSGSAQGGFNASKLAEMRFPIPPIGQQRAAVDRMGVANAQRLALQDVYRSKLHALASLKQSLLHRAFTGELTAAAPDTIAA